MNEQNNILQEKSGWPHFAKASRGKWFWVIIIVIILGAGFAFMNYLGRKHDKELAQQNKKTEKKEISSKFNFTWPDPNAKTIVSMPIDLNQVKAISKFRSCGGHDRAGYNFNRELEADRSMKHYFEPVDAVRGTRDKIRFLAPFDGTIVMVQHFELNPDATPKTVVNTSLFIDGTIETSPIQEVNEASPRKYPGDDYKLVSEVDPNAVFGFNHVTPAKEWKVGDKFKAGDLIGYSSLGSRENDFDMDYTGRTYKLDGDKSIEVLDSMFNHMSDSVLAEFAKYGITPANIIPTKAERDAEPCGYDPVTKYGSTVCEKTARGDGNDTANNDCFVQLKH